LFLQLVLASQWSPWCRVLMRGYEPLAWITSQCYIFLNYGQSTS
jgi:hypothetical protein